jgi:two-component system LytT family response regulator
MKRVLIIDDEPLARMVVLEYLQPFNNQLQVMQECGDGFEGIKAIMQHQPDLIFLEPPQVIFTTAFDEYAIKAFEAHAVDYLLKPFSRDRFNKAVEKFLSQSGATPVAKTTEALLDSASQSPAQHERIVVKTGTKVKIIPVHDVEYLAADDDYVSIHTAEGSFLKNKTMSFFEQTLDARQFVRVHRSYIIRISEITRIDPYEKDTHLAILKSGARVPVSKTGYVKLKQVLGI